MSFHSQLLALNGRLDLVVSQIEIRAHPIQDSQKIVASTRNVKTNSAPMARYVEGEESESESSDEEEEEEGQGDLLAIDAAEEGADEDIEDLVMANGDVSLGDIDDDDEEDDEEDEDEEDDIPALRKSKSTEKPKLNGFLDIEAEESENEGSDEDGMPPRSRSSGVKLNGVINEDSLDEDEEDLDRYESDFINDDTEEEEESDNAEGDDDDEE